MDLKDSIKYSVDTNEALKALKDNERKVFEQKFDEYNSKFRNPQAQEYFHFLVAAIMLEYNKYFEGYSIECNYRFKSPKSLADKIVDYISRPEKHINLPDSPLFDISSINDVFAMNLVLVDRPSSFHSKNSEINELIQEKVENQNFISKMQEFKSKLVDDEFSIKPEYIYTVTKKDYYGKCLEILDRLITLLPPEAENLINKYNQQKRSIEDSLEFIKETMPEDTLVDETDYPSNGDNEIDFIKLLETFSSRVYDKIDLAVLTKQAQSIFKNSELLQKFGVSFQNFKKKRAASGYTANFIYLKTPLGDIECQLQSKNQFRDGNIGESAHTKMKGKTIKGFKIPDPNNPEDIKRFKSSVLYIAPKFYIAKMDELEANKVLIQGYTDYKNYRKVLGQIQKGSLQEKTLLSYFDKLYSLRDKIFDSNGSLQEIIYFDINRYIKSDSLNSIHKLSKQEQYSK